MKLSLWLCTYHRQRYPLLPGIDEPPFIVYVPKLLILTGVHPVLWEGSGNLMGRKSTDRQT